MRPALKPRNLKNLIPWNLEISKPWNPDINKPQNLESQKFLFLENQELDILGAHKHRDLEKISTFFIYLIFLIETIISLRDFFQIQFFSFFFFNFTL
jgi:hypothetical protein